MKLHDWQTRFAPRILRRGEDYYANGAVRALEWDGDTLTASVVGSERYAVEIDISGGNVAEMSCSCPYAEEDNCKHMAAALFAAASDAFPDADAARQDGLKDAVQALSETDAKELLWKFARKYPEIAERILLKGAGRVTDAQITAWEQRIAGLAKKYGDRRGFIDYRNARPYVRDIKALLKEKIDVLLECGMPSRAFELTCQALSEASGVDIDDSDGGIGELWRVCTEHWKMILSRMDAEERRKAFDWLQANYRRWAVANDILDDFLFGEPDAAFPEAEFLRRKLELLDAQIAKASEDSYVMENCVVWRLDVMKKLSMDAEEIERYAWERYRVRSVRKRLTEEALQESRTEDAIRILRDSKKIDAKSPGLADEYSGKLIELYRQLNRTDDLRAELTFQLEETQQRDLRYVKMLKEITPPERWPELRERLLTMNTLSWIRGGILEMDGLYERLLAYAMSGKSMSYMDKFAETLGGRYPDEVREFYVGCLREEMERGTQRNYTELVKRLQWLKRLPGGAEAAEGLAREWRVAYPRRRSLLQELKSRGF